VAYYPFALFLLVGIVNCANLTDGLDGLATSVAAILCGFFALVATVCFSETVLLLSGSVLGGALGFLIFNYHPARVFMGDTGSLFLGAILAGFSVLLGDAGLIILAGALYLIEGISVILQVLYFKLSRGKRLFLMAPLHHHFERLGWSEVKVVSVFSLFSFLCCLTAFFAYM
jgi:phospho-N-acetylmuramoyl-pentapeptide-transferase